MLPMEYPLSVVNTFHGKGHTRSEDVSVKHNENEQILTNIRLVLMFWRLPLELIVQAEQQSNHD